MRNLLWIGVEDLIHADTQYIAVDDGYLIQRPFDGGFGYNAVNLRQVFGNTFDYFPRKLGLVYTGPEFIEIPLHNLHQIELFFEKIPFIERL